MIQCLLREAFFMQEFKIEIQFEYEDKIGYHYVFERRKDAPLAFISAVKVAEKYFRDCGWKKVKLISVNLMSNGKKHVTIAIDPVPNSPKLTPKPSPKRTVRSAIKAKPKSPTTKPRTNTTKRAPTNTRRTKPTATKSTTTKPTTRKTNRKPKR